MVLLSEVLRNKQQHRTQKKDLKAVNDLAETRIRLRKLEELENERKIAEEKIRIQLENERKEAEEKARLEAERIHKTIDFFSFDHLHRKIPTLGNPKYYGDNLKCCGTWIPHGKGDLYFDEKLIYRGEYQHGVMHGTGTWTTENGSIWEGEMKMGKMHGLGYFTSAPKSDGSPSERKEALMRNNLLCCYHEDLQEGLEVELHDPSILIGSTQSPHVTILLWNYGWNYLCRFHGEERPRQRNIDFSQLAWFKPLPHRPRCYPLSKFGIEMDQPQTYNYWKDTFDLQSRPRLGFAGGRPTANMTPLHAPILSPDKRVQTLYNENEFESLEMGIGLSLLEKEKEKLVEKKKQMWADALAAKRKEEAELKEKLLQEEQDRLLIQAAEKKQEKLKEKKALESEKEAKLAAESSTWEENQAQLNTLRLERQLTKKIGSENTLKRSPSIVPITSEANVWTMSRQVSESPLHRKVSRTLTRIDSRYQHNKKNKDPHEEIFEEGQLFVVGATVIFNSQEDNDDIPLFQKVPAFLSFSLDSTNNLLQRSESVLPLEEEVNRTYKWTMNDLQAISIHVTADSLDLGSLEITIFEDMKGRKQLKLASCLISFDALKREIGQEVTTEVRILENEIDKGLLRVILKIKDTTIRRR